MFHSFLFAKWKVIKFPFYFKDFMISSVFLLKGLLSPEFYFVTHFELLDKGRWHTTNVSVRKVRINQNGLRFVQVPSDMLKTQFLWNRGLGSLQQSALGSDESPSVQLQKIHTKNIWLLFSQKTLEYFRSRSEVKVSRPCKKKIRSCCK